MKRYESMIARCLICILALGVLEALPVSIRLGTEKLVMSNSILSIVFYVGIWYILYTAYRLKNVRLWICSAVLGGMLSTTLVIGSNVYLYDSGAWDQLRTYLYIFQLTPLWGGVSAHILYGYDKIVDKIRNGSLEIKVKHLFEKTKISFWKMWILIFACWLPALFAAFPGIYGYDAIWQMQEIVTGQIRSHHPIAHTFLLGGWLQFGKNVLGSYEMGMLLYSLFQMALMSWIFAYISKCIGERFCEVAQLIALLLYALLPYNALFAISSTKDVIFAGMFALFVLATYEAVRDMKAFFSSRKNMLGYVLITFLTCAFRNNGYYILLFMTPIFIIASKKYWKKSVLLMLACILLWNLYSGPFYNVLDIERGSVAEMLSIPMQQLSKVALETPEQMTEEQLKLLGEYQDYHLYRTHNSDTVKETFNAEKFEKDKMEYVKLWLGVGINNPVAYLDAFVCMNFGFWYPDMVYPDEDTWHPYMVYDNQSFEGYEVLVERTSYLPKLSKLYELFANGTIHKRIPVISMLFSPGATFWVVLIGFIMIIYKKRYYCIVPFSILIGLWGTLILAPVVLLRYAYPLMVSVPILLYMCYGEKRE